MRESLRMVEYNYSGKKTQREEIGEKSNKSIILLQTRHLQTERALKQTTNMITAKESLTKQEKPSIATIKLTASKGESKTSEKQIVAISEEDLKRILLAIRGLQK